MQRQLSRILWALMTLTVAARAEVLFSDPFTYPDGALTVNAAAKWATHSGTAGQAEVAGGASPSTSSAGSSNFRTIL